MGYVGPWNSFFLRAPAIIELGHDKHGMIVTSYSVEEEAYSLYRIHPSPDGPQFLKMEASNEFSDSDKYLNHLYKVGSTIVELGSKNLVMQHIKRVVNEIN